MIQLLQSARASTGAIFLYIIGLGFAGVIGYEVIMQQAPNAIALSFVYGVITYVVNSQGVKSGVDHTNDTVTHVAQAQFPLSAQGISEAKTAADAKAAAVDVPPAQKPMTAGGEPPV